MKRTALKRLTRLRPVNRKRRRTLWQRAFGAKSSFIRQQGCVICLTVPSEAAHAKSRGAGGGKAHLVPMCPRHHREQHGIGLKSFEAKHSINLLAFAVYFDTLWNQSLEAKQEAA